MTKSGSGEARGDGDTLEKLLPPRSPAGSRQDVGDEPSLPDARWQKVRGMPEEDRSRGSSFRR